MPPSQGWIVRTILVLTLVAGAYALLLFKRDELVDFAVPRRAAERFLAGESLYRPEDGHYQYKYLPAFAAVMVPFALLPEEAADVLWFTTTVGLAWAFVALSLFLLPDRRWATRPLLLVTLLLTGKFFVKELAFGQFNLLLGLFLIWALMAAQGRRDFLAGAAVGAGVFVKPYALVFVPWLVWTRGWRPLATFAVVLAAGLLLPVVSYGWDGNVALLDAWYRTVTETTAPNLATRENMSFASMWARWFGPGPLAQGLALGSSAAALGAGLLLLRRRREVPAPDYLEFGYGLLLIPLLSPQGWDYVLVLAVPAYVCLVDRWQDLSRAWRGVAVAGFFLTSFTIFDLLGRWLYTRLTEAGAITVGAVLIGACLLRLRWRALA